MHVNITYDLVNHENKHIYDFILLTGVS